MTDDSATPPAPGGLLETVRTLVGATATVNDQYGGIRIEIGDGEAFPWARVFDLLLDRQRRVWVRRGPGGTEILTQS